MSMRRGFVVSAVIVIAVLAASGGWLAGRRIQSPDRAALDSKSPTPSLITVEVELTELTADVITRADVGYDEPVVLSLSGALGGDRSVALVVTSAPERDSELVEGDPAIEIAGRPVFLLAGPVPVFRDLRPQSRGPDVQQLEEALARLGHFEGEPDPVWDHVTGAAVAAWYETAGYKVNGLSDEEKTAFNNARNQLEQTRNALVKAEKSLSEASEGPTDLELRQARTAVDSAELALHQARFDAEQAVNAAEQDLIDAEHTREQAARKYDQDQVRWQSAQTGVHPDTGDIPTADQHEALRTAVESSSRNLASAERAVQDAKRGVESATARNQALIGVRKAEEHLAAVQKTLTDLLAPPDTTELFNQVRSLQHDVNEATKRLTELEDTTGIWLPAGELIFLDRLPVRVDILTTERGTTVSGGFMTVTGSKLAVRGSVSERDVERVLEGGEARIEDTGYATPVIGRIRLVDRRAGTRGVAPDRHYIEILADGIPDDLVGRNVKIIIPVGGTDGAVLVVPAAALSATANGDTRVEVEEADGTTRFVLVEPGLSTGGLVEVTPVNGELQAGDRVVVGVASGE